MHCLMLYLFCAALCVCTATAQALESDVINVRQFENGNKPGAVGDGKTDDTAAIQAAADLAAKRTVAFLTKLGEVTGAYSGSSPVLYFPAGHYVISDEIRLGAYANVASDSRAIIEQKTGSENIFTFHDGYTVQVRGLRFLGGASQIAFDNKNIDGSSLDISECEFQLSGGPAIYTHGTWKPDDVHLSASLTINRSKFIKPRQVLRNVCDYAILRDCWVLLRHDNFAPDSAAFVNTAGTLMFDNLIGVPDLHPETYLPNFKPVERTRWVDNYGSLLVERSRFGGEGGGIPIVHHFGQPDAAYPFMGQVVSIQNSWICAGLAARSDSGVLTLRAGVPQIIRFEGNSYLIDSPYVRTDGLDLKAFLARYPNAAARFHVTIAGNMAFPKTPAIPVELEQFQK